MQLSSNYGKWAIISTGILFLTFFTGFKELVLPPPGLTNVSSIGAFINGNLPSQGPSGDIATTPIYTNIDWESPIVALPIPQSNQMMIVEMDGRFFSLSSNENTSSRTKILDIQNKTWYYNWNPNNGTSKHGGIQNAVFHPQFGLGQGKDYLYVYYLNKDDVSPSSTGDHYNRVSRFTWNGSSFNANSELIMINQYDEAKGHDGSGMAFGNDGFLYISVGDEGTQNAAATAHTQKINDRFRSGVWRIDVDQQGGNISHPINRQPSSANVDNGVTQSYTQGYYIPNDNPWVNPNGSTLEEFYAIGLRQPFRMTYDGLTNNFWIGDVGSQQKEEIDLLDQPGLNFEWNYKEGTADGFRPLPNPYIGTARPPIYDYDKDGSRAVIGGYVYRGNDIPQLFGKYIYGDNGTGDIFAITHVAGNSHNGVEQIATTVDGGSVFSGISSFGLNHDNEMLVLKLGAGTLGNGRIYRLTENLSNNTQTFPAKLSQTGVFANLNNLTPATGIIPYDVNNPLWSAGTDKKRWVAIPNDGNVNTNAERIGYNQNDPWTFPVGTVFIKHFGQPDGKKLETRLWIHGTDGKWFGTTYKWNNAGTDADVLPNGAEEQITIEGETFDYLYPSVTQCQTCHTPASGDVLGFRTHQLNRDILYPTTGLVGNQLETFAHLGFIPNVNTNNVITSYALNDNTKSLELRARSYFDSNCAHCHQPGANRALFDARYITPLAQQGLVNGDVFDDLDINNAKVIAPQDLEKSILYQRINTTDGCCAMPPLAKGRIDKEGVQLVANWINSLGADCANASSITIGNELNGSTNFVDGHNPAILINEGDAYTNTSGSAQEVCLIDFNFKAQRLGNPITPFVAKVNADNDFTILSVGQTRTSAQYNVGNNSFSYTNHSDDVLILQSGETIAIGFMDAFPDSPDPKIQSVIPAVNGAGEDEAWQSFTSNNTTNPALFPSLTVGKSPGLGTQGPANLNRSYKFNIGIEVSDVTVTPPPPPDCSDNLAIGKTATQSSTFSHSINFSAGKAIDGNTSGVHTNASMTHTNFENNAWWQIDLGDVYQLSSVKLWNRTNCCAERLSDFHVLVSDVPFNSQALNTTLNQNGVGNFPFPGTAGTETNINLNRTGRYLRVQLGGNNALTLAEVEIFGCEVSSCPAVTLPGRIEAEDFCDQSGVQAQPTGDAGGGENIGFVQTGDWMEYQISVPTAGTYDVDYRVASNITAGSGIIQLQINNSSIGNISIPYTGAWQTYTTVSNTVSLPQGTHTLRVFAQQAGWNLNWLEFSLNSTPPPPTGDICTVASFTPNPNQRYYIDVPQHNLRLAATGQSEDAFTTSTNTTGANVEWQFVDKGNGFWHIQRAAGGSAPRLRTDNSEFADMQATGSSGIYTYYTFCAGASANTHYLTLPDGPADHQRLQIAADGLVRFVSTASQGNSVSFRITEVPSTPATVCQCASGANSLLVNGSFEETSNPAYGSAFDLIEALGRNNSGVKFLDKHPDTDFPGWFTTGGIFNPDSGVTSTGGTLELGQSGFLGVPAFDGNVFVEMDGNHHDQIIAVTPGQVLDWEVTHRGRNGIDVIDISAGPVNNTSVITTVSSPNTQWVTHTGQYVVPAGVTQLQFRISPVGASDDDLDSSHLLDKVSVCPGSSTPTPDPCPVVILPGRIEAEDFCDQFGVQAQPTGDAGGGENIGFVQTGDWMEYEISVPAAGTYAVDYRVASNITAGGGTIQLRINNNNIGNISIPNTGGWQTYTTVSNTVSLPAGTHTLRVFAQQAGWNLNWIEFSVPDSPSGPVTSNSIACGDLTVAYGAGTVNFEGSANENYFFKINDLNAGWAVVGSCSYNCGNQFTVTDLPNSNYRLTVYNSDWSVHCEEEIEMTNSASLRGQVMNDLDINPVFGQRAKLEWYFLQEASKKVKQYLIMHSTPKEEAMTAVTIIPAIDIEGVVEYDYVHPGTAAGINFYQVIVQYEDGTENYQLRGDIVFGEKISESISIAPNPTDEYLDVDLSKYKDLSVDYFIQSIDGVRLKKASLAADHQDILRIDLTTIRNGIYILYVKPENRRAVAVKFVIAKDY